MGLQTRTSSATAGVLQQALRDVAAWAEKGIAPPAETKYHVDNSQIVVPREQRIVAGIQPTVDLTANRGERADVKVGEKVETSGCHRIAARQRFNYLGGMGL